MLHTTAPLASNLNLRVFLSSGLLVALGLAFVFKEARSDTFEVEWLLKQLISFSQPFWCKNFFLLSVKR